MNDCEKLRHELDTFGIHSGKCQVQHFAGGGRFTHGFNARFFIDNTWQEWMPIGVLYSVALIWTHKYGERFARLVINGLPWYEKV